MASVSFDCPESIQHLFLAPRDVIEYQRQDIVESIEIFNLYWDLDCFFSKMDYRELQEIQRALRSHKDVVQGNRSSILTSQQKSMSKIITSLPKIVTIMGTLLTSAEMPDSGGRM